jgi:hypothetical protein
MKVFRVEHNDLIHPDSEWAIGPYCAMSNDDVPDDVWEVSDEINMNHAGCDRHPVTRFLWNGLGKHSNMVVGMTTMEALADWFWDFGHMLDAVGFVLTEYTIPDQAVRRDAGQICFDPTDAEDFVVLPLGQYI